MRGNQFFSKLIVALVAIAPLAETKEYTEHTKWKFVTLDATEGRKLGSGGNTYGYFSEESGKYCFEVPMGEAKELVKLRLGECKLERKKQLWRVDGDFDGRMRFRSALDDDMCMEIRKKKQEGARVRINKCRKTKSNQEWVTTDDGDSWSPADDENLCMHHKGPGEFDQPRESLPIVVYDCDDVYYSLDFGS
mmetsp:Transcript_39175/g.117789  ORF Transcript_39175/g.117789 Transcript_39175/m.117789 type:complete len:192 (-) Transcript_39175:218-793(-)